MIARKLFLLVFAVALLTAFGCGGGGGGTTAPAPALACTDSGPAQANGVAMSCGGAIDSSTENVNAVIGGPASGTTTFRGINFDLIYDASKVEFVPAGSYSSALFPSALIGVALFNNQQGRLVVSVQEFGSVVDPVSVATGQHIVLSLMFRRVGTATFALTPLTFQNGELTSASVVAPRFTSGLALAYQ